MRRFLKITAKILGAIFALFILLVLIGPFLVPIAPLEGLASAEEVALDESNFITIPFEGTDGLDIHYLIDGENTDDAPTFVLLHGSAFNAFTWNEVMDYFGEEGQVIAYDQIPYGLSEKPLEGDWTGENPYTPKAAVDQLFLFLDELGVDNVILVGNSYGGTLATRATLARPERVDGLIFVDAAVYVQEEMPLWVLESPQMQRLGPVLAREIGASKAFIESTYMNSAQISDERMALTTITSKVENWDTAFWEYLQVWGATHEYLDHISEIQQPSLVVSGDSDMIVPVSDSERLASELPNAELIIIPSCGHVPQEECPQAFEEALSEWMVQWE